MIPKNPYEGLEYIDHDALFAWEECSEEWAKWILARDKDKMFLTLSELEALKKLAGESR